MPTLPAPRTPERSPERLFYIMGFVFLLVLVVIVGFAVSGALWLLICAMLSLLLGTGAVMWAIFQQMDD
jgi:hypothetical protein